MFTIVGTLGILFKICQFILVIMSIYAINLVIKALKKYIG